MELKSNLGDNFPTGADERILDIRPAADFAAGHLPGAVSLPVPPPPITTTAAGHFEHHVPSIFLPPREVRLLVVGKDSAWNSKFGQHLQGRGRAAVRVVESSALPSGSLSETGPCRDHLWAAPPWLVDHADLLPPPAAGPVLDLACGSGRAAVWLAERGYDVTGVDWQPEALAFGRQLAASRGASVNWQQADLRDPDQVPTGPWAVLLNFRFLQRDLLARMETMLGPGGVVFVRTFRSAAGYEGHPQAKHRLATCELPGYFPAGRCEILAHERSHDPDGRPAAGIVARRRA